MQASAKAEREEVAELRAHVHREMSTKHEHLQVKCKTHIPLLIPTPCFDDDERRRRWTPNAPHRL